MIDRYVEALITQTLERTKVLRGKIKNPLLSADFTGLQSRCEHRLDEIAQRLDYLNSDPDIRAKENGKIRIRLLRRAIEDLAQLECTGIAALNRPSEDDVLLSKLLFEIHDEINYPLNLPTVTCVSQSYYVVYPSIGLLAVPLAEPDFLLHLPDLYHEIAHPLLVAHGNPKVEGLQDEFAKFVRVISATFERRRASIARRTGPREYYTVEANILELSWIKYWGTEIFCDLFATYVLGPAYAWAHYHLTASSDADPFAVSVMQVSLHPPDQARMEVMLHALNLLGRTKEADGIRKSWNELLARIDSRQDETYRKACPNDLLEQAAVCALEGTKAIGCRLADGQAKGNIHELLNEAWLVFWKDPTKYLAWEKQKVKDLRDRYEVR